MIAVAGYFGRGNFGDDWMHQAWLHQQWDNDIDFISWPRAWPRLRGLNDLDRVVFLGGLLQDYTSRRSFLYYLAWAYLGQKAAKEGIHFDAASLGPLRHESTRWWLKRFLNRFGSRIRFSARDQASLDFLNDFGGPVRAEPTTDPTWGITLRGAPGTVARRRRDPSSALQDRPFAAERAPGCVINGTIKERAFLDCLSKMAATAGPRLILYLCDPARDYWQAEWLCRQVGRNLRMVHYRRDIDGFLACLAQSARLVSFRLHGAIAGARLGIPTACAWPSNDAILDKIKTLFKPQGAKGFSAGESPLPPDPRTSPDGSPRVLAGPLGAAPLAPQVPRALRTASTTGFKGDSPALNPYQGAGWNWFDRFNDAVEWLHQDAPEPVGRYTPRILVDKAIKA
ncbi:MAG: polysaccharide pyruvyl transferase family protein [Elusimicrobia bacterium]|nr:polysaccharide pyruvyl transferase family protein [Elusimicrobiota bacterium]